MTNPFSDPNFTQPLDWWAYNNSVTNNWFGHFLLIIILIVCYAALDKRHPDIALSGSLFLTMVIAMILFAMGLIPLYDIYIGLILLSLSIGANILRKDGY